MFRRAQNEQPFRLYAAQRFPHDSRSFGIGKNGAAHGPQPIGLVLCRMAGDDTIALNEKAVINKSVNMPVIGNDQSMMTLTGAAGSDKSDYVHLNFPPSHKITRPPHPLRQL